MGEIPPALSLNIQESCQLVVKPLVAWNWPWWEYRHHGNWQMIQIRTLKKNPYPRICFTDCIERGREKEREKHWCERETSRLLPVHSWTGYVPCVGFKPTTIWCEGWCSNQLSHWSRAKLRHFKVCSEGQFTKTTLNLSWKVGGKWWNHYKKRGQVLWLKSNLQKFQ